MTTIRELTTLWGFRVDSKALDAVEQRFDKLQNMVKVVGASAVSAAAAMFGLAHFTGEAGAEIKRAADRIGINVEALQEYQYAARLAGQTNEGFQGSLQTLTRNLFDARRGLGASREAFYLLSNVLGRDLLQRGRSAEEILNDVADGLQRVADPSRKLELAQQLFGGQGGEMISTLAKGSAGLAEMRKEARALGGVMSEDAIRASEAYHRELERAKTVVLGLRNSLGLALFPVVERIMVAFRRWTAVNREWLKVGLVQAFDILQTYISRLVYGVERAAAVANMAAKAFGGWHKVLRILSVALTAILAIKTAAFVGQLAMAGASLAAFALEGALAAAPIVALGAAIIGLLLILEDVYTYLSGSGKSFTGYLLKNFDGMGDKLDKWLEPVIEKAKAFGKTLGKSIIDGIAALSDADWQKIGTSMLKALELLLKVSDVPIRIGLAIADGVIQGLSAGLREKMPMLAKLLGITDGGAAGSPLSNSGMKPDDAGADTLNHKFGPKLGQILDKIDIAFASGGQDASLLGILAGLVKDLATPGPNAGGTGAGTNVTVHAPVTVNVPAGTDPANAGAAVQRGVKDALGTTLREAQRATAPVGSH